LVQGTIVEVVRVVAFFVIPHVVVLRQILERLCHREVDDGRLEL
jgi:hypothetical protein